MKLSLSDKDDIIHMVSLQNTIVLCSRELQQMSEGLSTLGIIDLIKKHPSLFRPFFLSAESPHITAGMLNRLVSLHVLLHTKTYTDEMKRLFAYIGFSTQGSSEREREQSVYMFFLDLLHECEGIYMYYNLQMVQSLYNTVSADNSESTLQLGDVLSFFTGADRLPPMGLPHTASIYFSSVTEYPTASTCAFHLVLPTKHWNNYEAKLVYGFKYHGGFGLQ